MRDDARGDVLGEDAEVLRQLILIGERDDRPEAWPDYRVEFGIGHEHIGGLIGLAADPALHNANSDSDAVWAPVHAWRALGQLQAEASVEPLLAIAEAFDEDEMADRELPIVFGMIGPAAIPHIDRFLSDRANRISPAITALAGLKEIAERHPDARAACVDLVVRMLQSRVHAHPTISGFAVWALIDLQAVEAIDTIRNAFGRDSVDISIAGDQEDVEIALGLRKARTTPAPRYAVLPESWIPPYDPDRVPRSLYAPSFGKVGRNEPCPCGSGRKYKKCCLQ